MDITIPKSEIENIDKVETEGKELVDNDFQRESLL